MKGEGVPVRELTESQHRALLQILDRVRMEHRARLTVLTEASGRPLGVSPPDSSMDLDSLASLAASVVAASTRLAALLGDPGASLVLRRGESDLVYLEPAGDLAVTVVFESDPPQGLERVRARLRLRRALAEIASALAPDGAGPRFAVVDEGELEALLGPLGGGD